MAEPTFPGYLSTSRFMALAENLHGHLTALAGHHYGTARLEGDDRQRHALDALEALSELAETLGVTWRPALACEGLEACAGPDLVASAAGLTHGELATDLARWASRLRDEETITRRRFQEIMALAGYGWGDPQ